MIDGEIEAALRAGDNYDSQQRIAELEDELDRFRNGYKGGCYACEIVGEKNVELEMRVEDLLMELAELRAMLIQRQPTALESSYE